MLLLSHEITVVFEDSDFRALSGLQKPKIRYKIHTTVNQMICNFMHEFTARSRSLLEGGEGQSSPSLELCTYFYVFKSPECCPLHISISALYF